ncbi:hypothetical protein F5Y03DRAFT_392308 [Xylaria venustula]|nr:hypothetical protein F5Y03DRAFT_392308 [Xylaria venustula]
MTTPRRNALHVGPCHCVLGRERYRLGPSIPITWEHPTDRPLSVPLSPLDSESDVDLDSEVDAIQDTPGAQENTEANDIQDPPGIQESTDNDASQGAVQTIEFHQAPLPYVLLEFIASIQQNPLAAAMPQQMMQQVAIVAPGDLSDEWGQTDTDVESGISGQDENDAENEGDGDGLARDKVPPIAVYRLNLTSLSQRYNMYAVAYRDVIHISRVRSCVDHSLPAHPDLVLRPPQTREGVKIGGYIDKRMGHQINHLIMGEFGDEEILLLAYDDGDVIGYYNSQIENALLRVESGDALHASCNVRPFFHQNVEISAWGLAIHKESRLIAVGNNHRQVHVFALALRDSSHASPDLGTEQPQGRDMFMLVRKDWHGKMVNISRKGPGFPDASCSYSRKNGYHIIVDTDGRGNNIPNVAFSNDTDGEALKVLAIDINGNLWVMDIWEHLVPHEFIPNLYDTPENIGTSQYPIIRRRYNHPRGWGVLVLSPNSFLPTSTFKDALGLKPDEAVYVRNENYGSYIGTKNALRHIKNNSTIHPWVRQKRFPRFQQALGRSDPPPEWYNPTKDCRPEWTAAQDLAADKSSESAFQTNDTENVRAILPGGDTVIRTYETDIELVAGDHNVGIMFSQAIHQDKPRHASLPRIPFAPERLAALLHVRELSLVVAGSMCGRVALITPTRPVNPCYSFKRGFRVEAILPKKIDEDKRVRPTCLLLGVAIGPIFATGRARDNPLGERRYRIMLHYYDHRILSYDVYRNVITNDLSIT